MKIKTSFFCTVMLLSIASAFAQDMPNTCNIVLISNPPELLSSGGGNYPCSTNISVCAYPSEIGWKFENWTIDSIVVSTALCFTFTIANSCTLVANFIKITDIADITETSAVNIYPNPTIGELTIDKGQLTIYSVEFYDAMGKKLFEEKENLTVLRSYDLTVFPAGIYFVRVTTEKGAITKKIVKY